MKQEFEQMLADGQAVSGDFSDISTISVSQDGKSETVPVRPEYLPKEGITVLHSVEAKTPSTDIEMFAGQEYSPHKH